MKKKEERQSGGRESAASNKWEESNRDRVGQRDGEKQTWGKEEEKHTNMVRPLLHFSHWVLQFLWLWSLLVTEGLLPNDGMKYWSYNQGKEDRKGGNKDNELQNLSVQILLLSSLCVITTTTFRRPKSEVLHSCIMNSQDRKGGEGDGDLLASKVILMMCWNSLALLGSLDWFNLKWPRSNHSWQPRGWGGPRNCRARGNGLILLLTGVTSIHPVRLIKKGCDLLEQNNGSLQI